MDEAGEEVLITRETDVQGFIIQFYVLLCLLQILHNLWR